jgi:hypothetical protein
MFKIFCKHKKTVDIACPYTQKIYTYCSKCEKKLLVRNIDNNSK